MVDYAMRRTQMAVEENTASSPARTDMSSRRADPWSDGVWGEGDRDSWGDGLLSGW